MENFAPLPATAFSFILDLFLIVPLLAMSLGGGVPYIVTSKAEQE